MNAREQWIQELSTVSDLATKVEDVASRIVSDLAGKISLTSMGRQLRDVMKDEELGALVMLTLMSDNADESVQEAVDEAQAKRGAQLGAQHSKEGLEQADWEYISKFVFAGRVLPEDDFLLVADGYRDGYDNAVEWRPLFDEKSLPTIPPYKWQVELMPNGMLGYRARRDGWAVPWALVEAREKSQVIREYAEGMSVEIAAEERTGRPVVRAFNQGGHDSTEVDLLDLIDWIKSNKPELLTTGKVSPK